MLYVINNNLLVNSLRKGELDKGKSYIITCQSGNRNKAACGILEALGYKVEDMIGGMNNWNSEVEYMYQLKASAQKDEYR